MYISETYLQLAEKYNLSEIKFLENMTQSILVIGEGIVPLRCAGVLLNMPELGHIYAETDYDICMEYDETIQKPDYMSLRTTLEEEVDESECVRRTVFPCDQPLLKNRRIRIMSLREPEDHMTWKKLLLEGDCCIFCLSAIHPLALSERQFIHAYLSGSECEIRYVLSDMDKVAEEERGKVTGLLERFLPGQKICDLQNGHAFAAWISDQNSMEQNRENHIKKYIRDFLSEQKEQIRTGYEACDDDELETVSEILSRVQKNVFDYCKMFPLEELKNDLNQMLLCCNTEVVRNLKEGIEEESDVHALKNTIPGYVFGEWEAFLMDPFLKKIQSRLYEIADECEEQIDRELKHALTQEQYQRLCSTKLIWKDVYGTIPDAELWEPLSCTADQIRKTGKLSKQELLTEGKKISGNCLEDAMRSVESQLELVCRDLQQDLDDMRNFVMDQLKKAFHKEKESLYRKFLEVEQDLEILQIGE